MVTRAERRAEARREKAEAEVAAASDQRLEEELDPNLTAGGDVAIPSKDESEGERMEMGEGEVTASPTTDAVVSEMTISAADNVIQPGTVTEGVEALFDEDVTVRHMAKDSVETETASAAAGAQPAVQTSAPPVVKQESIRATSERLLRAGHGYDAVLTKVREAHPSGKTTIGCIRWYAAQMRKKGETLPDRPRASTTTKADEQAHPVSAEQMGLLRELVDESGRAGEEDVIALLETIEALSAPIEVAEQLAA